METWLEPASDPVIITTVPGGFSIYRLDRDRKRGVVCQLFTRVKATFTPAPLPGGEALLFSFNFSMSSTFNGR